MGTTSIFLRIRRTLIAIPNRMNTIATAFSTSADARLKNIAIGMVSVLILVAPARVTEAPNSPIALAHVTIAAANILFLASGRVTLRNASALVQPNVLAANSYLGFTLSNAAFNILTLTANTTVNCAKIRPAGSKTNLTVWVCTISPKGVEKNIRSTAPKAIGGITIGMSNNVSTKDFPGNSTRDSTYANGIDTARAAAVDTLAVTMLSFTENMTSSERRVFRKLSGFTYDPIDANTARKKKNEKH
jgi:hypothetical protein